MVLRAIHTELAPRALGPYSQAVVEPSTGLVFCSGQIGLDPATGELVAGGVVPEFRRAMENVRAVLEAAGASLAGVVRVTLYLAEIGDFAEVNAAYGELFHEPFPARSTLQAAALPKGARIEIEVTAILPRA